MRTTNYASMYSHYTCEKSSEACVTAMSGRAQQTNNGMLIEGEATTAFLGVLPYRGALRRWNMKV